MLWWWYNNKNVLAYNHIIFIIIKLLSKAISLPSVLLPNDVMNSKDILAYLEFLIAISHKSRILTLTKLLNNFFSLLYNSTPSYNLKTKNININLKTHQSNTTQSLRSSNWWNSVNNLSKNSLLMYVFSSSFVMEARSLPKLAWHHDLDSSQVLLSRPK